MALSSMISSGNLTHEALLRVQAANAGPDFASKVSELEWAMFWQEVLPWRLAPTLTHSLPWFWFSLQPWHMKFLYVLLPVLLCWLGCCSSVCFAKLFSRVRACWKAARDASANGSLLAAGDVESSRDTSVNGSLLAAGDVEPSRDIAEADPAAGGIQDQHANEVDATGPTALRHRVICGALKCFLFVMIAIALAVYLMTMDGLKSPPRYDDTGRVAVFRKGEQGYHCIKIPSLIRLSSGTLLAFGEARVRSCSDFTWTDIVMKRSVDNGTTWSPLQVVRAEGRTWKLTVVGNVAPVQLRKSGRILLPHTVDNNVTWQMHSDDEGLTWSQPFKVKGPVNEQGWRWVATGPPTSIQLSSGRVITPSHHGPFRSNSGNLITYPHTMFSDDDGDSWQISFLPYRTTNFLVNEQQAVELRNGSVLFISRSGSMFWQFNSHLVARSDDHGLSISMPRPVEIMRQPLDGCEGSIARGPDGTLLFVSPAPRNWRRPYRQDLTLFESHDEGSSWSERALLHPGGAGYTSLTNLGNSMGLLYEVADAGEANQNWMPNTIAFLKFDLNNAAPSFHQRSSLHIQGPPSVVA